MRVWAELLGRVEQKQSARFMGRAPGSAVRGKSRQGGMGGVGRLLVGCGFAAQRFWRPRNYLLCMLIAWVRARAVRGGWRADKSQGCAVRFASQTVRTNGSP